MRPVGDAHVHPELLHRGIEKLLQRGPQTVDFVDEEDVAGLQGGEHADQVAGALEHGARRDADVDAQLARHEHRQRGLAEARRAEEQGVVQRLLALLRGVDRDLQRFLHLRLADELVEPRRAQRRVADALLGEHFGGGDLGAHDRYVGRARHCTGRVSAWISCRA